MQQSNFFVEADRVDLGSSQPGLVADRQMRCFCQYEFRILRLARKKQLAPKVTGGCIGDHDES